MKSFFTIIIFGFIIFLSSLTPSAGQEKKSEQRIKIVISDDKGTRTVMDTVIADSPNGDTIIMKNGRKVFIKGEENGSGGNGTMKFYTVTSTAQDSDDHKKEIKEIIITGSDSDELVYAGSGHTGDVWVESGESGGKNLYIFKDDKNKDSEKTKYVINRDGMAVTVEGSDYEEVKELVREIESFLDRKTPVKQHLE